MCVEFAFPPALLDLRENINDVTDLKLQFVFIGWLIAEEHLTPAARHCKPRLFHYFAVQLNFQITTYCTYCIEIITSQRGMPLLSP